ncbi:MAG: ABC transporter permease subunit [Firmicutes bacterium]|nr:ABC transporter permease subunit [Bacillota bacterium]MBQ5437110.1 ABC transporter permease subunit [Bacillota bacterium]
MEEKDQLQSRQLKSFSDQSRTMNMGTQALKKLNYSAVTMLLVLMAAWYFGAHVYNKPFVFPYFEVVMGRIGEALTDLAVLRAIGITMRRVLLGTLYGFIIGLPLGMAMGFSPLIMKTLSPFVNAVRQIPTTAWVPLAIIWFGLGDGPTLFVLALHGVFVIILNTAAGVMDINPEYYNAVKSMGAGPVEIVKDVIFPGALPGVITGIRLAMGMGWMTVV